MYQGKSVGNIVIDGKGQQRRTEEEQKKQRQNGRKEYKGATEFWCTKTHIQEGWEKFKGELIIMGRSYNLQRRVDYGDGKIRFNSGTKIFL